MNLGHLIIAVLSFLGFGLSLFVFLKHRHSVHSYKPHIKDRSFFQMSHGRLFGVPFEILGMLFYGLLFVSYIVFLLFPTTLPEVLIFGVVFLSGLGVFFSLVLMVIEACVIRKFDILSSFSALLCMFILSIGIVEIPHDLLQVMFDERAILVTVHLFAMVLGLGGATYSDILLMRFLKDFKISLKEAEVLETLGQVIWLGVGLALVSGLGLFLPEATELLAKPKFLAKMVIFIILVINGALLHLYVLPHILQISFHEKKPLKHLHIRTAAFVMGAVSATSWYSVFLLGSFKDVPLTFVQLMSIYCAVVVIAIVISLNVELFFVSKSQGARKD